MTIEKIVSCPTALSDAELDAVAAGEALINVSDLNVPVNVNVPVVASVAANVLEGTANSLATLPTNTFMPAPFGSTRRRLFGGCSMQPPNRSSPIPSFAFAHIAYSVSER